MTTIEFLQTYWWLLIAVFGGILVFLLFVQGGQSMLLCKANDASQRSMMVNALGRKWELTFTTLVVFGGAFFASFPLFYSTSFGGAYWLWMLILFSFILQAVSYEFRSKPGNIFGTTTYDVFLFINGLVGCVLLGVAVGMFFFGGEFTVMKTNLLDTSAPVISIWAPSHGLEAIADWRNLLLGFTVFFLARTLASLYFINSIDGDKAFAERQRRSVMVNGGIFVVLFLTFAAVLLTSPGVEITSTGVAELVPYKYLDNLLTLWWGALIFVVGVVLVLLGILSVIVRPGCRRGIWPAGIGTFLVVVCLFCIAGYNSTAYYPSTTDLQSSLTIANSSSSEFTLKVMSYASLLAPFVIAYIAYVWAKMNATPITEKEMAGPDHKY